jgi:hypothetical protein
MDEFKFKLGEKVHYKKQYSAFGIVDTIGIIICLGKIDKNRYWIKTLDRYGILLYCEEKYLELIEEPSPKRQRL